MEHALEEIRQLQLVKFTVLCVWKVDSCLTSDNAQVHFDTPLINAFKNRFGKSLPMEYLDLVVVHTLEEAKATVGDEMIDSNSQITMNKSSASLKKVES